MVEPRPHEVASAYCTSEKSEKLLNYQESIGWLRGIKRTVAWAKKCGPQEWKRENLILLNEKAPLVWREMITN